MKSFDILIQIVASLYPQTYFNVGKILKTCNEKYQYFVSDSDVYII